MGHRRRLSRSVLAAPPIAWTVGSEIAAARSVALRKRNRARPDTTSFLDERMRFNNYNIWDELNKGHNNRARIDTEIELPAGWRLRNSVGASTQRVDIRNFEGYGREVMLDADLGDVERALLTDPQTSGGLLVACAQEAERDVLAIFRGEGFGDATVIGRFDGSAPVVRVVP